MDSDLIKILLYVGAAVIYFIFKNSNKSKKNVPNTTASSRPQRDSSIDREEDPFEQLLKEVAQKWEEKEAPTKPVFTNNSNNKIKRAKQQPAYSSTSDSSLEGQGERELKGLMSQSGRNEGMSEEDRLVLEKSKESKKFKEYETKIRSNSYHDLAKDPKRLREAFVMGEILQRKY